MNMKEHILSALRDVFTRWETLLAALSEEQIAAPLLPSAWTTKDVMVHLWAWQQRSTARMDAGRQDREPVYPRWNPDIDLSADDSTDLINDWIYQTYRDRPWQEMHQNWRDGFLRFLEASDGISEKVLLDSSRFPWMDERPLAFTLLASYDHHQEHLENLQAWLKGKNR